MYEIEKKRFEIELLNKQQIDATSRKMVDKTVQPHKNLDTTKGITP